MSWSVQSIGKAPAVAAVIESQFKGGSVCAEPEETVRQSARALIAAALSAQAPNTAVKVGASGSQSSTYDAEKKSWGAPFSNSLSVNIEVLSGFAE